MNSEAKLIENQRLELIKLYLELYKLLLLPAEGYVSKAQAIASGNSFQLILEFLIKAGDF